MKVEPHQIKIRDLVNGYVNSDTEGVKAYGGSLDVRPKYQRNFVYKDKQRDAVIASVRRGFPISIMYWVKKTDTDENGDETVRYEVLDGQQRTISICSYYNKDYSITEAGNFRFFHNLTETEQKAFLDYEITVYICEGTDEEELDWFRTINIAGEKLTEQELRNAVYAGSWLSSAKEYFTKPGSGAQKMGDKYITAEWNRQGGLERALQWIGTNTYKNDAVKIKDPICAYMADHQHDENANDFFNEYKKIIQWVERVFPTYRKEMKKVDWGYLYYKYSSKFQQKDAPKLEKKIQEYMADEDITKKSGIYAYVLGEPEKVLSIRAFKDKEKREAYERQGHKCPMCQSQGIETEYEYEQMEGDHIVPWSQGGKTEPSNLQMLCHEHNAAKSGKSSKVATAAATQAAAAK